MKKLLLFFVLTLTVCSTAMAEILTAESAIGAVGTFYGREAMVVDLGGSIGKVAIATMNVGATSTDDAGQQFIMAEANDPAKNGLTGGWYVPSKDELTALLANLEENDSKPGLKWQVSDVSTLYFPAYEVFLLGYCGMYVSSSSDNSTLAFTYDESLNLTAIDVTPVNNPEDIGWSVIRPFHKLPNTYYTDNGLFLHEICASEITSSSERVTMGVSGEETWYVVTDADVQFLKGAVCVGDVNLILADGAKLTATGEIYEAGIGVTGDGNSLTIYGQNAQTGQLIANGGWNAAGIGGGCDASGSNITINGGIVTANGGYAAAGIGGGQDGDGYNITINGGTITANGGGTTGAGIGGADERNGYNITINGGTVTANGARDASGIGGGFRGDSNHIYVAAMCIVKAGGSPDPTTEIAPDRSDETDIASVLAGKRYATVETPKFAVTYGDNITVSPSFTSGEEIDNGTQITFTAADRSANDYVLIGFYKDNTFDTPITTGVSGQTYTVKVANAAVSVYARYEKYPSADDLYPEYYDPNDATNPVKTVDAYEVTSSDTPVTLGDYGKTIWYVVTGTDVKLSQGAVCHGAVHLILADGAKLTANGPQGYAGITVTGNNSLTIYGQIAQSGQLIANGGMYAAGIGGGDYGSGSNITINGGTVRADGGVYAAGIGGGRSSHGSNIAINGGTITANGGEEASGIGGGYKGSSSNITVATTLFVRADGNNPPKIRFENNGGDLAESLADKQYVTITEEIILMSFNVQATPADENEGSVSGSGIYEEDAEVTLTATPAENYVFEMWSDGTTANPYVFPATKDVTLTASFKEFNRHITDGTEYTATESESHPEVTYTRTFSNTDWQALYVPFSMKYDEWSEKFEIAKIHNFIEYDDDDDGEFDRTCLVVLKLTSGSTKPNYPYLIRAKETGTHSLVLQDKTLEAAEITAIDCRSVENEYTFTGTYTPMEDMYAHGYYAMSGGSLKKANAADVKLNAQRWYMELTSRTGGSASAKAQSIQILVDGEEGIMPPSCAIEGRGPVAYDLTGRAVNRAANVRGINISNGKKVIR